MLTIESFSSLSQLGAGLALALAIFSEPIANRERAYRLRVENLLTLIPDRLSGTGLERSNMLLQNLIDLDSATDSAKEIAIVPMWMVKVGALINFAILIMATICPDAELTSMWTWLLLAFCVVPIGMGTGALFAIAHFMILKRERSMTW